MKHNTSNEARGAQRGTRRGLRAAAIAGTAILALIALSACGGDRSSAGGSGGDSDKVSIYLTNNFSDNDYRQQMIKTAEIAATMAPYKDQVELTVSNSEASPQAQSAMINNIIQKRPDAIIMEAASPTAVNPAIKRACDAGIVVVTFDSTATEPCAWKVSTDWVNNGRVTAAFMAQALGGKGKIALDRGLAGNPIALDVLKGQKEELNKYPDVKVVGEFEGGFNPGQEQSGVASVLASNPDLDGASTIYIGSTAGKAFAAAGKNSVVYTGTANNQGMSDCLADKGAKCIFFDNSSGISVFAMQVARDVLDGTRNKDSNDKVVLMGGTAGHFFVKGGPTSIDGYPGASVEEMKAGKNVFPDASPSLVLPIVPSEIHLNISPEDLK